MYYDYEIGLKTPYSIQVFRSPKGKVIWYFAQPVSLRFIGCVIFTAIATYILLFKCPFFSLFGKLRLLVYPMIVYHIARWYEETEIAGRRGTVYLRDCIRCVQKLGTKGTVFFRGRTVNEKEEEFYFTR